MSDRRHTEDTSERDAEGSVVADRYVLKAHLGTGRYGEVYEAVDRSLSDPHLKLEQRVVLHLLHAPIAQQTRLLQKLEASYLEPHLWSHPNTVKVSGFGLDRGRYFLVTELLAGVTLRSLLDSTRSELPPSKVVSILRGTGDALSYAHAKGAIHGDIRPEKIFITSDSAIKVLDLLPASSPRAQPFFVEDAATGGPAAPDPRDDVYGLACVAYELLTGRHPFNALPPLDALNARLTPAPIPQLGAPRWDALARGLALRREHRTASVAAFLGELGIVGHDAPRPASEPGARAPSAPREPVAQPAHPRDDDMPIIGDYSDVADLDRRPAPVMAAEPPRAAGRDPTGSWRVDPRDVHRYAKRAGRRERREPLGSGLRLAAAVLIAAAVGLAAYWNYEPLRSRATEWFALARNAVDRAPGTGAQARSPGELETIRVEPPVVVEAGELPGAVEPLAAESPAREPPAAGLPVPELPAAVTPATEPAPPEPLAPAPAPAEPPVARATEPPAPETFEPVAATVSVSEGQAAAAITVRRRGGSLGESAIVWWTTDGSATPGDDYADLGTVVAKFAAGEETHTIHVPIIGDSTAEGRESFYVNIAAGDEQPRDASQPAQRVEVFIDDDD